MLAVAERVTQGMTETLVWHKPVGRVEEEFQAIACSDDEGITFPPPKREVPLRLDASGERWCAACLDHIRSIRANKKGSATP